MSLGRVDRYELLELIGQGSFGGVYRARHVHTGRVVALKLARANMDADAAARILAEGRAVAGLHHPNVVGVLDGGLSDRGEAFVVMELLEGGTLADLTKSGPLPLARAVGIALEMLDGLEAAHAHGVVHRDVKPSNVFLTRPVSPDAIAMVKVIDFGISKVRFASGRETGSALALATLPGVAMGTPGYMAPEQLGDARSVDARADIYSVGATLYEMLSGKKPIEAASFEAWVQRLQTETPVALAAAAPFVPAAVGVVVDQALARDRDARWPTAKAMRDALALALVERDATRISVPAPSPRSGAGVVASGPGSGHGLVPAPVIRGTRAAWTFAAVGVSLALLSVAGLIAFLQWHARGHGHAVPMGLPASTAPAVVPEPTSSSSSSTPSPTLSPTPRSSEPSRRLSDTPRDVPL